MADLVIPREGPCAGHPCDNCATCRRGRCCRRDNPDYKLPELGDWEGPIYGDLGVLADDGNRVECHCCGEWFVSLQAHIANKHDLTAAEYRALFGLNKHRGLCSVALSEQLAARQRARMPEVLAKLASAREVLDAMTPEQQDAMRHHRHSLESKLSASKAKGGIKTSICVVCGLPYTGYWVNKTQACGIECAKVLWSRSAKRTGLGTTHRPPQAKLSMEKARQIRRLHNEGRSIRSLAKEFGIAHRTTQLVLRNETWKEGSEHKRLVRTTP